MLSRPQKNVPINGTICCDHYPSQSRNTQQRFLFCSHCGCDTGGIPSGKFVFRKIMTLFCPLEGHGTTELWNPLFRQIFGSQRAKIEGRNMKMYRVQDTHPMMVNARYEMIRANSFCKKLWKFLSVDRRLDERTDIRVNPKYSYSTFGGAEV